MKVDTIFHEIEKRLDSLDKKREELMQDVLTAQCCGNGSKANKLLIRE